MELQRFIHSFAQSKRKISHFSLSWHGMLCKGSGDIYNYLMEKLGIVGGECTPDGKFSLDACRCVGACGLAPVMMVMMMSTDV